MATSGSIQTNVQGIYAYTVKLSWTRTSYSVTSNSSTLSWTLTLSSPDSFGAGITFANNQDYSVNIGGISYSGTSNCNIGQGETKTLASGTTTLSHNADGTKSFSYSFTQKVASVGTASQSGSSTLDTIIRIAELSTAPNFTDEENPTITYSNPAGNSMTTLQACIANSTGNAIYVPYRDISKTGSSYTFNLTIDERNTLRAAASGSTLSLRFYVKSTIHGSTNYRFLDRTMTLEDIEPIFSPTVKDTDTTIVALTGDDSKIILGYSDIYYNIGVSAPAGTSIITQSIKCGAQSSGTNTGTFTDAQTNVLEFSATDSRGNVANERIEMDVIPYIKVTCNQIARLNLDGTVALTVKGNYFSDSFGAQENELKIEHRSRESGGEWTEWGDISVLLAEANYGTYTLTGTISGFDPSGTYEFQARASDKLSSAESSVDSVTLKPIFDWGKYDFNFNVPLTIEGDPLDDYVIETGTEAMGTNGTWYWSKWRSGKAECYGCRNYGNMAVTTAWGSLFRSESFSQTLPSGLFADTPEVIDIRFRGADRGGWIANHEETAASDYETGGFILVRPASATLTQAMISFNVIGRWK